MRGMLVQGILISGIAVAAGCGGEPVPGQPGGTVSFDTPEMKKAREEAPKETPEQMMEKMKAKGDPTRKK